jgi:hypothetical protein
MAVCTVWQTAIAGTCTSLGSQANADSFGIKDRGSTYVGSSLGYIVGQGLLM